MEHSAGFVSFVLGHWNKTVRPRYGCDSYALVRRTAHGLQVELGGSTLWELGKGLGEGKCVHLPYLSRG